MPAVAIIGVLASVAGVVQQQQAQAEAKSDQKKAEAEQRKARDEQKAQQAAQSAQERRAQIREERVRRARIVQSSENTGVGTSSGSSGATGDLATTLGANLGYNIGQTAASGRISDLNQSAADFMSSSQSHINTANNWGQVGSIGQSIFGAAGGFKNFTGSSTPQVTSSGMNWNPENK